MVTVPDTGTGVIIDAFETVLFCIITFVTICPLEDGVTALLRGIWRGLLPEAWSGFAVTKVGVDVGI